MRPIPLLILLIISSSCGSETQDWPMNKGGQHVSADATAPKPKKPVQTQAATPAKTNYATIREFGQAIIDGKQKTADDNETIACLDSLDDKKPSVRKFYFNVYKAIASQSDGALSEVIGGYLAAYIKNYGQEALLSYEKLKAGEKETFADYLADYFHFSKEDPKAFLERSLASCYCEVQHDVINSLVPVLKKKMEAFK